MNEERQVKPEMIGKEQKPKFWDRDTDTIIYTIMCIASIPAILLGLCYLYVAKNMVPQGVSGCVFQLVLGLYCPGCGGTRAFWSLFQGDILRAIYYNPGGIYGAVFYVVYFVSQTLMRLTKGKCRALKMRPVYLYIMLGIILLNFAVRNILLVVWGIETL